MAWFERRTWSRRRADRERQALAASIEELAAQGKLADEWDEEDEQEVSMGQAAVVPPALSLQSHPWPVVHIDKLKHMRGERAPSPEESSPVPETPATPQPKRLGRSTKIHLQAVRLDQAQTPTGERVPAAQATVASPPAPVGEVSGQAVVWRDEVFARALSQLLRGSGVIGQGRDEVTIAAPQISARSVVTVTLTSNPGPVVVQYVSLHPQSGFTFHLSAPVVASTTFNYLIWPC